MVWTLTKPGVLTPPFPFLFLHYNLFLASWRGAGSSRDGNGLMSKHCAGVFTPFLLMFRMDMELGVYEYMK
jgi:hypothetical protein